MQWLICHILRQDYTFAELTTRILRLTRIQIQNFIIEYLAEYRVWIQYEQNVSRIPWCDLVRYAVDRQQSVAELLHVYRPSLPTDVISREGIASAARFLHARGLGAYATGLDGWFGIGKMDFLDLNVQGAMVRDTLDREAIARAAEWGWIDVDEVVQRARQRARRLILQADAACPVAGQQQRQKQHRDVFLGTMMNVTTTTTTTKEVQESQEPQEPQHPQVTPNCTWDGVHITPRCNRTVWSGILDTVDEAASAPLMQQRDLPAISFPRGKAQDKRPNRRAAHAASKAQMEEICLSLSRQLPEFLPRHVPGSVVLTAEERARAAEKPITSTWNAPRRTARTNLRKAATSRASQARMSPPEPERILDCLFDSPDACQVLAAASGNGALNPSQGARRRFQASRRYQDVSVSVSAPAPAPAPAPASASFSGNDKEEEPVEPPALSTRDTPVTPDSSNIEHHTGARGAMNLPATQACSAELRKALDSTFLDYLRAENN
ncbi:hypothetical protein E4U43_005808, partial [Claviceps pusilla]